MSGHVGQARPICKCGSVVRLRCSHLFKHEKARLTSIAFKRKARKRALKLVLSYKSLISLKEDRGFQPEALHWQAELPALLLQPFSLCSCL